MPGTNELPPNQIQDSPAPRTYVWRTLRQITRHQWLYLPRLFSRRERAIIAALLGVGAIASAVFAARIIDRVTVIRPAAGGVFREGSLHAPQLLNPIYATNDADRDLSNLIFSGLIRYDHAGKIIYDLAEGIDISKDETAYTARLRPNVLWHDGKKLSADDVVATIHAIQDPEYKSPLRQNWQGVTAEKIDGHTVRFSLRQPYAPFLENLSVGIVPADRLNSPQQALLFSDPKFKPIGAGPYQFARFTQLEDGVITSVTLKRNKQYYREGPYIDEIQFSFHPSEEDLIASYRRNDIDSVLLAEEPPQEFRKLDADIHSVELPKIFAVFLNSNTKPALGRKAVRSALAMAIDRQALLDKTASPGGSIANTAIPAGTFGFNADISPISYDPEAAKKILATDGWKDDDRNGVLARSEGSGSRKKIQKLEVDITTSDAPGLRQAADLIAENWRAIGVKTEVKVLSIRDLETSAIKPRAYETLLFGELFGHDPDPFAFWHTSQVKDPGLNIALYSNRAVDQLLEAARRESDTSAREKKYREFQKIVSDDIGAIFLYSPTAYYAVRNSVHGVSIGAIAASEERFNEINGWYLKTRRALKW